VVIIADDVESEALATLVVNRLRGTVQSVAVRAPESGDRRREMLDDLAVLTGARLFTADLGRTLERFTVEDFGRVKRTVVDRDTTTLVEGGGRPEAIRERIARVRRALETCDSDYDRDWLRQRLGKLTGGVAVIRVGAPTELAMAERRSRVEDALAATRAALEEGMVTGGGVALLRGERVVGALDLQGDEAVGRDVVLAALAEPARQIADNAGEDGWVAVERIRTGEGGFGYDAARDEFRDLDGAGIMDPAKVTRCALQHAASIGSMLLTTDAIVVDVEEEGGEAAPE
jgi:chaperonin GroEL